MSLNAVALGQRIKAIRKSKKLTQQALSERVDCSPTYISYIESGQKTMSLETLVAIANVLETSTDLLLADSLHVVSITFPSGAYDTMDDCSIFEQHILNDILWACKQSLLRNRRFK